MEKVVKETQPACASALLSAALVYKEKIMKS
jgi:hypothetical protein